MDSSELICAGYNSCPQSHVNHTSKLHCLGEESCRQSLVINVQEIYCGGYRSCLGAELIEVNTVWCIAENACEMMKIKNAQNIHFLAPQINTKIEISRNIATINVWAKSNIEIICNDTATCVIHCMVTGVCNKVIVTCLAWNQTTITCPFGGDHCPSTISEACYMKVLELNQSNQSNSQSMNKTTVLPSVSPTVLPIHVSHIVNNISTENQNNMYNTSPSVSPVSLVTNTQNTTGLPTVVSAQTSTLSNLLQTLQKNEIENTTTNITTTPPDLLTKEKMASLLEHKNVTEYQQYVWNIMITFVALLFILVCLVLLRRMHNNRQYSRHSVPSEADSIGTTPSNEEKEEKRVLSDDNIQ